MSSRPAVWAALAILLPALALAGGCRKLPAGTARESRLLTTIPDVRALAPEMARQGWPVRVRGAVTYVDKEWGRLFIQDQDAALAVDISGNPQDYARGEMVDVAGWTGASDITPVPLVLRPTIGRIITTKLGTPPAVPLAALNAATCNGSRLQTTGEVKEAVDLERLPAASRRQRAALGGSASAELSAARHDVRGRNDNPGATACAFSRLLARPRSPTCG